MGKFFKFVFFGCLFLAVLSCFGHHSFDLGYIIGDLIIEPVVGLGAALFSIIVTLVVVGVVFAALAAFGGFFAIVLAGIFIFSGLVISWPVLVVVFVLYLMVREKPISRGY